MNLALILIVVVAGIFIAIGVHEMGHLLFGLCSGFKFKWIVIGPFGLKREDSGGIKFYIEKNMGYWGGMTMLEPTLADEEKNLKLFSRILIGGPVFSLVVGGFLIIVGLSLKSLALAIIGFVTISLFFATGIPMPVRIGFSYNDAGRWLRINKNGQEAVVERATWNLTQSYLLDKNFLKCSMNDIHVLKNDHDLMTKYFGYYFAYAVYKEQGKLEIAQQEKAEFEEILLENPKLAKKYSKIFKFI